MPNWRSSVTASDKPPTRKNDTMKPTTITTATADQICRMLETLELDTNNTAACIIGVEIRGLIAADVEEPEHAPIP